MFSLSLPHTGFRTPDIVLLHSLFPSLSKQEFEILCGLTQSRVKQMNYYLKSFLCFYHESFNRSVNIGLSKGLYTDIENRR